MKKEKKPKNPKRVAAGRRRWEKATEEERRSHMSMMGKKGGTALWKKLRPTLDS